MAGGIIQDPTGAVFFLTTHILVPSNPEDLEQCTNTKDDDKCAYIGNVKHTDRKLGYCLVTVSDLVADSSAIAEAGDCFLKLPLSGPKDACLHPDIFEEQFSRLEVSFASRCLDNQIKWGMRKVFNREGRIPCVMLTQYDAEIIANEPIVGTWVYAKRTDNEGDAATIKRLNRRANSPYSPEVFRYYHVDKDSGASTRNANPLILVGLAVYTDFPDRWHYGMPVTLDVHNMYEILTDIYAKRDQLNDPRGEKTRPLEIGKGVREIWLRGIEG